MAQGRSRADIPATPRVVSPSPTPTSSSERRLGSTSHSFYSGPTTRSTAARLRGAPVVQFPAKEGQGVELFDQDHESAVVGEEILDVIDDDDDLDGIGDVDDHTMDDPESENNHLTQVRSRNLPPNGTKIYPQTGDKDASGAVPAPQSNGFLSPSVHSSTAQVQGHNGGESGSGYWGWRALSRSPSPMGLIPSHRQWRTLVHKHEVPRKVLHMSIGLVTSWLYAVGARAGSVTPWLFGALVPITTVDVLRLRYPPCNSLYVRLLGALMRESEVARYNGVVFYLLGAWLVLTIFPEDVAMTAILLLSWCDTAASTFGRMFGHYTPRIRRGKSLAGSLAAFVVGIAASYFFWGYLALVPSIASQHPPSMFKGILHLPAPLLHLFLPSSQLPITDETMTVATAAVVPASRVALLVLSVWSGLVAALSELVDVFGLDDNLTIPVLSGLGIWGFLKVFG